jgi:hypothetical protein
MVLQSLRLVAPSILKQTDVPVITIPSVPEKVLLRAASVAVGAEVIVGTGEDGRAIAWTNDERVRRIVGSIR